MTRFTIVGDAETHCEPSLLLRNKAGQPVAAGWAAWHMALLEPHRLAHPVLGGVVFDVGGCANMLQLLLAEAGIGSVDGVAVAVPAVANRQDVASLARAVVVAAGAPIVSMRSALTSAARHHERWGGDGSGLLCDVGASVVEVGALWDGSLREEAAMVLRAYAFVDDPVHVTGELVRLVHKVLGNVPGDVSDRLRAQPVRLIGGAQQSDPLVEQIMVSMRLDLTVVEEPETAVVTGLAHAMTAALDGVDRA